VSVIYAEDQCRCGADTIYRYQIDAAAANYKTTAKRCWKCGEYADLLILDGSYYVELKRGDRWPVVENQRPRAHRRASQYVRDYDRRHGTEAKRYIEYDRQRLVAKETRDAESGATVFSIFTLDGTYLLTESPAFVERHEVCDGEPHGNSWCDGERYILDAEFIEPGHPAHCPACRRAAGRG